MNAIRVIQIAEKIIVAVEEELSGRSAIHWEQLNDSTRRELKLTLTRIVAGILMSEQ
jgi:hypothetical protein